MRNDFYGKTPEEQLKGMRVFFLVPQDGEIDEKFRTVFLIRAARWPHSGFDHPRLYIAMSRSLKNQRWYIITVGDVNKPDYIEGWDDWRNKKEEEFWYPFNDMLSKNTLFFDSPEEAASWFSKTYCYPEEVKDNEPT